MSRDNRMSRMLHVLIHMDRHMTRATSEQISKILDTNPVFVRRMMAGLRDQNIVTSTKGAKGGWALACKLDEISLFNVYKAIGEPTLFSIGPKVDHPDCLVEQAVDERIDQTLSEAEALLMKRFKSITVEDIAQDFEKRLSKHPDKIWRPS